ncbi:MAG: D-2-hydroxyacid dehydrogenase, partial [Candidatus Levybacteria bacterium]|nr:D-2-hydroxyacid dehydrogenase [Candidatus Levybacteria bacterium]
EGKQPLLIRQRHIEKIKFVDKSIELTEISSLDNKKLEKELSDSEVLAGISSITPSIKNAKNLKWIHVFSAGVEKILTPQVVKSKIIVSNSAGIHATPIAEHVIGFMLIFTKKFYETFQKQKKKIWEGNQDLSELKDKTVLIVGLGHIGEEVARLSHAFGANVVAVKKNLKNKSRTKSVRDKPNFVSKLYAIKQLNKVLPMADFVVLSLPITKETHHLFDMKKIKLMKKSGVLINIGRGGVVNEKELVKALASKIIAGAALDVTEEEPLPKQSRLWEMENVVITPHHSGWSERYMDRAIDIFVLNLKAYLRGKPLPNLVDKKRGY